MEIVVLNAGLGVLKYLKALKLCGSVNIKSVKGYETIEQVESSLKSDVPALIIVETLEQDTRSDWLESLKLRMIDFAIVGTNSELAELSIRTGAFNYLLPESKLKDYESLLKRFDKHSYSKKNSGAETKDRVPDSLLLWEIDKRRPVSIEQILKIKSDGSYSEIYLKDDKVICSSKNLGLFETLLKERKFMRIHNTCLINLRHVKYYKPGLKAFVALNDSGGIEYVSKSKKREFLNCYVKRQ